MYKKNQNILLLIQELEPNKKALNHALKIANIFKSKVLISTSPFSKNKIEQTDIEAYISKLEHVNTITLDNTKEEPNKSIEKLNIIFLIIEINNKTDFKLFLKNNIFSWILKAKIPSLLISRNTSSNTDYSNIILPIDHKKESKEKMIWASYFGRFNNSVVQLILANEKEDVSMKTIRNTLAFTKKMFSQFIFEYKIHKSKLPSKSINEEAFKTSTTQESDLVILMTDKTEGILFPRYNSSKIKHYMNTYSNPILLINPMKDYYLPCDS
ncbi:hypothetical protein [Ancylomarina sp. 16SWW S1-10-2]|uniref:hypothetical protein n=1 Tax=Ancylomarina sp. 16SWW S1-10-2 TaxID=2499681 RepID=UPI0012ADFA32|nr:hypothetical protein [Ancylomarina sp. 16SWW S1-10-2]MRT93390.1 hypothetical protein [Ancylomarina sp. 16SWW S1-10-2]